MLGFQTDWNIKCSVFDWTQIGVFLWLGFIAKKKIRFWLLLYVIFLNASDYCPKSSILSPIQDGFGVLFAH